MSTDVAYLGPAGTFTESAVLQAAARGDFGIPADQVHPVPYPDPASAVAAVRAGKVQRACLAIENSVDGAVTQTFDALAGGGAQIYHEVELEISFTIMRGPEAPEVPATIATHPVAHRQIVHWLSEHLPGVEFVPASSNAAAAEMAARGEVDAAAAPDRAADLFGLTRLATNVADIVGARTRFVVVGLPGVPTKRTGRDRTSVVFTITDGPGSLIRTLDEFAQRGVSLSRIESRPTKSGLGSYNFYVDFHGHIDDRPVAGALQALWLRAESLKFLGSWPAEQANHPPDDARITAAANWVNAVATGKEPQQ